MDLLRILLFFVVTVTSGTWVESKRMELPTIMYFPDGKGNIKPGIIFRGPKVVPRINDREDVKFYIYTRGEYYQLFVGDVYALRASSYDSSLPTYIITHGYQSSVESDTIQEIKDSYLNRTESNVFAVDWSGLANDILYPVSKGNTIDVGAYVAKFIDFLVTDGNLDISKVHLSGHSLGAHVMGIAGKNVKTGKVGRITGMDPAGPLYSLEEVDDRLAVGDATFVDIIHTCAGLYGFEDPLGDVDFFPNGGHPTQPGCGILLAGICSHSRSWEFFAESINSDNFKAVPCDSYENFQNGSCNNLTEISMGEPVPTSARGLYFLNTGSSSPFALG